MTDPTSRSAEPPEQPDDDEVALELAVLGLYLATPALTPSAHVRTRLLASTGGGRLERFAARFAEIFDVPLARARELLGWVDDPTRWEPFVPATAVIHFPAGPACAGADTGFVRVAAGEPFPSHEHLGPELTLIVQGGAKDHTGTELRAGDEALVDAGSAHDFVALPGEDLVYAVRVAGVRFPQGLPAHVTLTS